jgi:nucleotide sugar dehydrogenase
MTSTTSGKISLIGFGKIGQAVAANILQHGIRVNAVDTDAGLSDFFASGCYRTNEPGLQHILTAAYADTLLTISGDFATVKGSFAIIVAIPLLIDEEKKVVDEPFLQTIKKLSPGLENNTLVVIETSIPVGFSRGTVLPVLESAGKKHGRDFLLAHSPERIKSGTMLHQLKNVPKVIGGLTKQDAHTAYDIYSLFFDKKLIHIVESVEAAEIVKLAGMIYRDINIALSNQLAQFANAKNIDYTSLIPLINTDGEANLLQPGIGVGGHCTPVYPYFLINNFKQAGLDFSLATHGRMINNQMAAYALSLVNGRVRNRKALILGLSFRPNVKEDSLSTTYLLHEVLLQSGYEVKVHDTEYSKEELEQKGFQSTDDIYSNDFEVVFLVTMHREYKDLDFGKMANSGTRYFVDGRNNIDRSKVQSAGIEYIGIGH